MNGALCMNLLFPDPTHPSRFALNAGKDACDPIITSTIIGLSNCPQLQLIQIYPEKWIYAKV
jgi:hypothetical protein